jgi:hypothetical protein
VVFSSGFLYCSSLVSIKPEDAPSLVERYDLSKVESSSLERVRPIELAATVIGIPVGILAMGWLTTWVIRGFRSRVE